MRQLRITRRFLGVLGACSSQYQIFSVTYARSGVVVYDDQNMNVQLVVDALDAGLNVPWLIARLMPIAPSRYGFHVPGCFCEVCVRITRFDPSLLAGALADAVVYYLKNEIRPAGEAR